MSQGYSCLAIVAQYFNAETELIQGQRSCEGVATWALFSALIYYLQTATQVIRGPNAHSQPLSCFSDINQMRHMEKKKLTLAYSYM